LNPKQVESNSPNVIRILFCWNGSCVWRILNISLQLICFISIWISISNALISIQKKKEKE